MRIYFVSHGFGLGHVGRDVYLAEALKEKGHEVIFSTYGNALEFLSGYGFDVIEVKEFGRAVFTGNRIEISRSLFESIRALSPDIVFEQNRILKEVSPDLIIVDGYVPAMVGKITRLWKDLDTVLITNETIQWKKIEGNVYMPIRRIGELSEAFIVRLADKIIVPDFPPPYTICDENLSLFGRGEKFHFVGPLVPPYKEENEKKHILISFGGAHVNPDTDSLLFETEELMGEEFIRIKATLKREKYLKLLKNARVVITHGGHTTIMESLAYGKPIVGIPIKNYPEREGNLKGIEKLGLGRMLDIEWADKYVLTNAISEVTLNEFRERQKLFKNFAKKMNGIENAAKIIESN